MIKHNPSLRILWPILFLLIFTITGCQSIDRKLTNLETPSQTVKTSFKDFETSPKDFSSQDVEGSSRLIGKCTEPATLSGRISLNYTLAQNEKTESLHGKFTWKQHKEATLIGLYSPLGQAMALIIVRPELTILSTPNRPTITAPDPDELLYKQLGWPLPVAELGLWLLGCATDSDEKFIQASPQNPELTTTNGWFIRYNRWVPYGESQLVPKRIDMTHSPPQNSPITTIKIRVVVDDWELTSSNK